MEDPVSGTPNEPNVLSNQTVATNMSSNLLLTSDQSRIIDDSIVFTSMHKHFLVVLVLALTNAILGLIYFSLTYKRKQKYWFPVHDEDQLRTRISRRQCSVVDEHEKQKRRKYSTHIALAVSQSRESARRVSSVYL